MSVFSYPEIIIGQYIEDNTFDEEKQEDYYRGKKLPKYIAEIAFVDIEDFRPFVCTHTCIYPNGDGSDFAILGVRILNGYVNDNPYVCPVNPKFLRRIAERFEEIKKQVEEKLGELGLPNDNVKIYIVGNYTC